MSEQNEENAVQDFEADDHLTPEEKLVQLFLMFAFPFLIGFVTWGVIILAYYQWLVY